MLLGDVFFSLCNIRLLFIVVTFFFFQAEDGIRDLVRSRGLGDVYKRQELYNNKCLHGPIAQLGERYNGIVEVKGSNPFRSTPRPFHFGGVVLFQLRVPRFDPDRERRCWGRPASLLSLIHI